MPSVIEATWEGLTFTARPPLNSFANHLAKELSQLGRKLLRGVPSPLSQPNATKPQVRLTLFLDIHNLAQLSRLTINFDPIMQELLEGRGVENVIAGWDGVVDVEFMEGFPSWDGFGGGWSAGLRM